MMRKLGVSAVFGITPAVPFEAQMPLIKRAGFDVCFAPYKKDEPLRLWADLSEKLDLPIETLHAPFDHMNTLWIDAPEGEDYLNFQLTRIDGCSEIGVEKCVMHVTIANTAPPVSDVGLRRFRKMCDYAQEKGVRLCFENLEIPGHLAAVLADNPEYHGFCWDCGSCLGCGCCCCSTSFASWIGENASVNSMSDSRYYHGVHVNANEKPSEMVIDSCLWN